MWTKAHLLAATAQPYSSSNVVTAICVGARHETNIAGTL